MKEEHAENCSQEQAPGEVALGLQQASASVSSRGQRGRSGVSVQWRQLAQEPLAEVSRESTLELRDRLVEHLQPVQTRYGPPPAPGGAADRPEPATTLVLAAEPPPGPQPPARRYLSTTTMGLSLPVTTMSPFQIISADDTIMPKFSTW